MPNEAFNGVLRFLETCGEATQAEQARVLSLSQPQISNYSRRPPTSSKWWFDLAKRIYDYGYKKGQRETSAKLVSALIETFGEIPQVDLAAALGVTQPAINHWVHGNSTPSRYNFAQLLGLHVLRLVEPLAEFRRVSPVNSGSSYRFDADRDNELELRDLLHGHAGIYVFYDSSGRVTYLGKTSVCLWTEAKQRLKAKVNRPFYAPTLTKGVQQGEIVRYVSAYKVRVPAAIHNIEVLMLRAIPNDSANKNIGKFKEGY